MCGGVWELVGCIEVRDLGYDLPACIDRLGGFSTAQHSEQKAWKWFLDFGHSFRISYTEWRRRTLFGFVLIFVEEGYP